MQGFSTLAGGTTLFGLLAAGLWGGGDFSGSVAVQRSGGTIRASLRVVVIGHLASLAVLAAVAFLTHSSLPSATSAIWGVAGGLVSGVALIAFYFALAGGHMGSAASVSGLLCAAIPAIVSQVTEGLARWPQFVGFALAATAIWLIASVSSDEVGADSGRITVLAALSGAGFGFYFVALKQAGLSGVLWPTVCARVGSAGICTLLLCVVALRSRSGAAMPGERFSKRTLPWILGGATLDLLGNLCFMQATRMGRLDVAAVLASIYPAGTILLAALVLHEKTTPQQRWGMALALPAVVLITL